MTSVGKKISKIGNEFNFTKKFWYFSSDQKYGGSLNGKLYSKHTETWHWSDPLSPSNDLSQFENVLLKKMRWNL